MSRAHFLDKFNRLADFFSRAKFNRRMTLWAEFSGQKSVNSGPNLRDEFVKFNKTARLSSCVKKNRDLVVKFSSNSRWKNAVVEFFQNIFCLNLAPEFSLILGVNSAAKFSQSFRLNSLGKFGLGERL